MIIVALSVRLLLRWGRAVLLRVSRCSQVKRERFSGQTDDARLRRAEIERRFEGGTVDHAAIVSLSVLFMDDRAREG